MIYRVLHHETEVAPRCLFEPGFFFRLRGLLGRASLAADEGILLRPCNAIHMWFMKFPIDALFLDRDGRIVKIYHSIRPWQATRTWWKVKSVLEVAAGTAARTGLKEGDLLTFREMGPS